VASKAPKEESVGLFVAKEKVTRASSIQEEWLEGRRRKMNVAIIVDIE